MAASDYVEPGPAREEIDSTTGQVVLEFGANWCGICQAARQNIEAALEVRPKVQHIRVADGPRRPLGRSFHIKFWPTLIFLKDGQEITRLVRPTTREEIDQGLE